MEAILKQILSEVSNLSVKIDHIDAKVDNLESKFNTLETKVDNLEVKFNTLESKVDNLETKVDNLTERVTLVEQAQVRMENVMNTNFAALYDAREMQNEFNERIEAKVDILNSKIDTIALQVNHHEHRFNRLKSI
ncbi:MAG: hypothetical protein H6Q70_2723 [Firmicutes bacterium]|jgi:peptidoglycan hydrolase CwlO-like protein|nr:hypothetical protein [Bacillota bacterium]